MKMKLIAPALLSLAFLVSCGGGSSSAPSSSASASQTPAPSSVPAGDKSSEAGPASTQPGLATSSQEPGPGPGVSSQEPGPAHSDTLPNQSSEDIPPVTSSQDVPPVTSSEDVPPVVSSQDVPPVTSSEGSPAARKQYLFEAEHCPCIEDMEGATYSGGTSSYGLIGKDRDNAGASGGYYVHFMYVQGDTLEFNIVSDKDVEDVTFVARFSAEYRDIEFNVDIFPILVNEVGFDYGTIKIENVPDQGAGTKDFADFTLMENLPLKKGNNCIQFVVANNILMYGTALSTAPMIDCIKLTTSAGLTWPEECPENVDQLG